MKWILAIDPGNKDSAYALLREDYSLALGNTGSAGKFSNDLMLDMLKSMCEVHGAGMTVVIEMVASYGMAVGKEIFDTCVWIGRFAQAAADRGCQVDYIYRIQEKMALCHNSRARDANIRQALIDRFARFDKKNGKGTKKQPDVFYGFRADMWAAFAVGVTWLDKEAEKHEQS